MEVGKFSIIVTSEHLHDIGLDILNNNKTLKMTAWNSQLLSTGDTTCNDEVC